MSSSKDYHRKYRAANRAKINAAKAKWLDRNREASREHARKWYSQNKPHRAAYMRAYRQRIKNAL